ncbi:dynamin family protein [Cyanobacteria bacterium FACHB-472]|nr:dynamin family protein [Cyanobacteria bacterium FACHB-472]
MSSQQFQETHESIYKTGTRLSQYLKELRAGRLSEGYDTKGLQSVEDDIKKALNALKEQKYQVAVIAAMKAGKSTFLNALIGADILASESEACTVCRTDIRPIDPQATPRLLEYREGQRKSIAIAEGEAGVIRQKFLDRTHELRTTANSDNTTRFELQHPIEAISKLSSLTGFTLVDTPGPNEWESASFSTVALKQTALEALRTCDAILFVLDYSSFKDNTNSELLQDLIEQRGEFLAQNTGKIYFILNKVDRKAEGDREIENVIADLRQALIGFGIPEPIIYPASAWQGLLAKLILQNTATDSHIKNFKRFFSARYAIENEEGDLVTPAPRKIAPQALEDSNISRIEQSVIQTVVQNSGWNLLNDVLAKLDKAAKAIEDTVNTQISGWEMEFETLKQKVEEYRKRAEYSKNKVEVVKKSVQGQKEILIKGFERGINIFAEGAKAKIQEEIEQIADTRSNKSVKTKTKTTRQQVSNHTDDDIDWGGIWGDIGGSLLELIPGFGKVGNIFRVGVKAGESLLNAFTKYLPDSLNSSDFDSKTENQTLDPYKIRLKTKKEAKKLESTINEFCSPHIQNWWLDTQDKLVRDGTQIREELAKLIQNDIQEISDELSQYLGNALQVELNINPIQFPNFEFTGIDAQIQYQQEVFTRTKREKRRESRCCKSDKVYHVDVEYKDNLEYYEVDLRQTAELINLKIDEQAARNRELLQRVIDKQISEDFRSAEKQINDYIKRFQDEFDQLLRQRETREAEASEIRGMLEAQKVQLTEYLQELTSTRQSLDSWKPIKTVR